MGCVPLGLDDLIKTLIVGTFWMRYCSPVALKVVKCAMSALQPRVATDSPLSGMSSSGYPGTLIHDLGILQRA